MNVKRGPRAAHQADSETAGSRSRCATTTTRSGVGLIFLGASAGLADLALPYFGRSLPEQARFPALVATALGVATALIGMASQSITRRGANQGAPIQERVAPRVSIDQSAEKKAPAQRTYEHDLTPIRSSLHELMRSPARQPSQVLRNSEATPFMQRTCATLFAKLAKELIKGPFTVNALVAAMGRLEKEVPDDYKRMLADVEAVFTDDLSATQAAMTPRKLRAATFDYMRYIYLHTFTHSGLAAALQTAAASMRPQQQFALMRDMQNLFAAMAQPDSDMQPVFDRLLVQGRTLRAFYGEREREPQVRRALEFGGLSEPGRRPAASYTLVPITEDSAAPARPVAVHRPPHTPAILARAGRSPGDPLTPDSPAPSAPPLEALSTPEILAGPHHPQVVTQAVE